MKEKPTLDDLIRDAKRDAPTPDWKSIDDELFARLEQEPRPASEPSRETEGGRVVWIGAALTLAAAAAAIIFVHPVSVDSHASHDGTATTHSALASGDRIDTDHLAYFAAPEGAVHWVAQAGSSLRVEHASSPLVLALDKGVAEAQVTPVPSGEAFAIDVTSSSGSIVRVAVHGTHLRVARDGDKVIVDLTEGVVSIGAPPRRGSTIGTLVTAPAHVELDARDLSSIHVDHELSSVRRAEAVVAEARSQTETASLGNVAETLAPTTAVHEDVVNPHPVSKTSRPLVRGETPPTSTLPAVDMPTRTLDDLVNAIGACGKDGVAPNTTFATSLTLKVGDDGMVQLARFSPPFVPEGRDCATNIIYKRAKLTTTGDVTVPIEIKP